MLTLQQGRKRQLEPTEKELAVLQHAANGEEDKVIARALHISPSTVHFHMARVMEKLGASNRTHAAVTAVRKGLFH